MEHGHRVAAGDEARLVEGVDRHVQHERTLHLLAEAAEVRSAVEVGVEDAQVAQLLRRDDGLRGADRRAVAAVLHHGAGQAAAPGEGGSGASLFHRGGQRLLAQHVTAGLQRRCGHRGVGFGNGDVAHHRRRGLGDRPLDGSEVRHLQTNLGGTGRSRLRRNVHQPHHLEVGTGGQVLQPPATHGTAAHHQHAPARRTARSFSPTPHSVDSLSRTFRPSRPSALRRDIAA